MAKREVGEINAGSMADIAFLLLIFFLVTTTMEVDAGIGRQLPLKIEYKGPPPPPVHKRNVLEILANSKDELLVEDKPTQLDDLYDIVKDFYTVNKNRENVDINMPNYQQVTIPKCEAEIAAAQALLDTDPENKQYLSEVEKWKEKLALCKSFKSNSYSEIHKSAVIQLKNQAGTTYGLYMEVQNILKKVVNELRVEACREMGYPDYFELREDREEDQLYISNLRILVPERIIESKIDR